MTIEAPAAMPVICRPPVFLRRRIMFCPVCKHRRRFAVREALWYGPTATCCGCGDSFGDGERLLRPARRGWRKEAVAKAKRTWDAAGPFDRAAWELWFREQLGEPAVEDVPTGASL